MTEKSWDLTAFHEELLYIFREFEKICIKHNLRYYSSGGTTIGALRHGGFIPWDDDMDIEMPRADFVKFLEVYEKEMPMHLRIHRGGVDGPIWGTHLVDEREGRCAELEKQTGLVLRHAPFIDIFYIDGVPSRLKGFFAWYCARVAWRMCLFFRFPETMSTMDGKPTIKSRLGRLVGFFLSPFYRKTNSVAEMMRLQDELALRHPFDESDSVVEPAFFRGRVKRIVPRNWYGDARVVKFENGTIRIPERAEERCYIDHADYMELPPEEWRIPEHAMQRAYNHV